MKGILLISKCDMKKSCKGISSNDTEHVNKNILQLQVLYHVSTALIMTLLSISFSIDM